MNKRDVVANILYKAYLDGKTTPTYCKILSFANQDCPWSDEILQSMRHGKIMKKKKFYITDIVPISCKDLPSYYSQITYSTKLTSRGGRSDDDSGKGPSRIPIFSEKSGLFKICFNDDSVMFFAKWYSGGGKATILEAMFATEDTVWRKWMRLFNAERKKRIKPKVGVFRIRNSDFGTVYEPLKKIPNNPIFHTELDKIRDTVNYYFANVSSFMKYNQAGRRSLLLYGEQGTSKTSTLYTLAKEHYKTKSVVFSTDINALASHIMSCEKYNMPTLAFFEDAEGVFSQNNSDVKNFLSGIDAKQNKGGTCIVYTTNYPERMEETIIERPERIDELHYIGPIEGTVLIDCAKFYFGKFLPDTVKLEDVLTKPMTGAEVKLMVENTLRYCASERLELDENAISIVLNKYIKDLKKLKNFTDNAKRTLANKAKSGNKKVGFGEEHEDFVFSPHSNNGSN